MYRNIHFDPFMFFSVLENCLQLDTFIRVFKYQGKRVIIQKKLRKKHSQACYPNCYFMVQRYTHDNEFYLTFKPSGPI